MMGAGEIAKPFEGPLPHRPRTALRLNCNFISDARATYRCMA